MPELPEVCVDLPVRTVGPTRTFATHGVDGALVMSLADDSGVQQRYAGTIFSGSCPGRPILEGSSTRWSAPCVRQLSVASALDGHR
jgi:hypothetical protein